MDEIQQTPLEITIDELQETKKKVFVKFNLSRLKNDSDQSLYQKVPTTALNVPTRTVFNVLMVQHTPPSPAIKLDRYTSTKRCIIHS